MSDPLLIIEREHQQIVDELYLLFSKLNVGTRRPQMIYNSLYHPDAVITFDNQKFTVVELINSSYGFDTLGILSLVMTKDILDGALIIVTDKMFSQSPEKFSEVKALISKFNFYSKGVYGNSIAFLREYEVEDWLKEKVKNNGLWKP